MREILTVIFVVIPFVSFSQGTIEGYVIDSTTKEPLAGVKLTLLTIKSIKLNSICNPGSLGEAESELTYYYDTSWNRTRVAYSDLQGYYRIDSVGPDYYKVYSFFKIKDEMPRIIGESEYSHLFQLAGNQKQRVDFQLGVFCSYDLTKNLTECPKCHKSEGVRIQIYGLPADIDKALEDDGKNFYNGYCVVSKCQPTKICLQCNAQF